MADRSANSSKFVVRSGADFDAAVQSKKRIAGWGQRGSRPVLGQQENAQAVAGALFERDRFGLAGLSSAIASLMTSDFDAEPVLRFRVGFALVCGSAAAELGATGAGSAVALRPRPPVLRTSRGGRGLARRRAHALPRS